MGWFKRIYRSYMKAAEENNFTFSEYGFMGERYKKRKND